MRALQEAQRLSQPALCGSGFALEQVGSGGILQTHVSAHGQAQGGRSRRPQAGAADLHHADQRRGVHRPGPGLLRGTLPGTRLASAHPTRQRLALAGQAAAMRQYLPVALTSRYMPPPSACLSPPGLPVWRVFLVKVSFSATVASCDGICIGGTSTYRQKYRQIDGIHGIGWDCMEQQETRDARKHAVFGGFLGLPETSLWCDCRNRQTTASN